MSHDTNTDFSNLPAKDRILLTAHDLFYRDGIRATGVDKVIAESGVTKVTFYRHFPSKNDLIRAFLEYRHRRWMDWFVDALRRHGGTPGGGLMPLLPVLEEWFCNPLYRGCAFINTVAELGGALPDVVEICSMHKQEMVGVIGGLLLENESRQRLAYAAVTAIDGAILRAQLESKTALKRESLQSLSVLLAALERSMIMEDSPRQETL